MIEKSVQISQPIVILPQSPMTASNIWIQSFVISSPSPNKPTKLVATVVPIDDNSGQLLQNLVQTVKINDLYSISTGSAALTAVIQAISDVITEQWNVKNPNPIVISPAVTASL